MAESNGILPDGSAFFTMSFPLPKDHWLYAPNCAEWDSKRDTSADTPLPIIGNDQRKAVQTAIRWAVRGATMNGKEMDFDPDALVLNAAYALCGPAGNFVHPKDAPPAADAVDAKMAEFIKWLADRKQWLLSESEHGGDRAHLDARRQECGYIAEKLRAAIAKGG